MIGTLLTLLIAATTSTPAAFEDAQLSVVKVYGSAAGAGLEGYQTGVIVDADEPLILTADGVALDGDTVVLIDAFGDRFEARVRARDSETGLALLESSAEMNTPALPLAAATAAEQGDRVWVLSNAFNIATGAEPVTVQRARVAVTAPIPLAADPRPRPGVPAAGQAVVLLDAVTSNPGAAGGVVINSTGVLVGVIGAECRSPLTGSWINYAVPAESVAEAIGRMRSGSSNTPRNDAGADPPWRHALLDYGLSFVPTLGERTPPYVEAVLPGSPAAAAGLLADDLVIAVNGTSVSQVDSAGRSLLKGSEAGQVRITVLREERLVTLTLDKETR